METQGFEHIASILYATLCIWNSNCSDQIHENYSTCLYCNQNLIWIYTVRKSNTVSSTGDSNCQFVVRIRLQLNIKLKIADSVHVDLSSWRSDNSHRMLHPCIFDTRVMFDLSKMWVWIFLFVSLIYCFDCLRSSFIQWYNRITISRTRISRILRSSKRIFKSKIHFECFLQP